jgi:mannosyl-3-phosphoglycerate phosphatase
VKQRGAALPWLVFTDLDGTLLDHDSYDWSPARPALDRLHNAGVPVIAVTSKTLAELAPLAAPLGLDAWRIAENGAVIAAPEGPPRLTPPGHAGIRDFLAACRREHGWRFQGFTDLSVAEVAAATGLSSAAAALAKQRLASEPIRWLDSPATLQAFRDLARRHGLTTLEGGRFLHVLGDTDKGRALRTVARAIGGRRRTIALGDSANDHAMLAAADQPIIVRRKDGSHLPLEQHPAAVLTRAPGPTGWNQALLELLDREGD